MINWKLIFGLSLIGLGMALATTYVVPMEVERWLWIVIMLFNIVMIVKFCSGKYFLNGFLVSIANCVWITSVHILLMDTYISNNPSYLDMLHQMPMPDRPRVMALMMGPVVGIIFGIVQGVLAWLGAKLIKK
jgi:hypothetical protein